jgi:acyl-CoA dehydrogenase
MTRQDSDTQLNRSAALERLALVAEIGDRVARPAASDVDRNARFPVEAIDALKKARLLSAAVPRDYGGAGATLSELSEMCVSLGQHCSATAMVTAMHHIQVVCIARHAGTSESLRSYLRRLVQEQRLIASVTSEVGIGGDMRSSLCAVQTSSDRFQVQKDASTISYGEHTDDLLLTARRSSAAPSNDQVLVLLERGDYSLERSGAWDTLGMRGTCSPGFKVNGSGARDQILPVPFGDVASATMVPVSHVLWASVWLGIATDAVARARTVVRAAARKALGTVPPTALRLAEVTTELQTLRLSLSAFIAEYESSTARPDRGADVLSSIGFALKVNQLKVSSSELAVKIVSQVLCVCGIAGYRNDTPQSVGRHLRDVYSSILMIGNDRIHATNAALLLVHKGD